VSCYIGIHVFIAGWAPAVLVLTQPIKPLRLRAWPMTASCNWVGLLPVIPSRFSSVHVLWTDTNEDAIPIVLLIANSDHGWTMALAVGGKRSPGYRQQSQFGHGRGLSGVGLLVGLWSRRRFSNRSSQSTAANNGSLLVYSRSWAQRRPYLVGLGAFTLASN